MKTTAIMIFISLLSSIFSFSQDYEKDVVKTSKGDLAMTFIGHGTLMFEFGRLVIHIDPTMREAKYQSMPDADLILVTHQHGDHLDITAINHILKEGCEVVMTPEMVADAALAFRPSILYPYHLGRTNTDELVKLLENEKDIEVRIRELQ